MAIDKKVLAYWTAIYYTVFYKMTLLKGSRYGKAINNRYPQKELF